MGIFNKLKKIIFGEEEYVGTTNLTYTLPTKYSNFPMYPGVLREGPIETSTNKYDRLTFYFKYSGKEVSEYLKTIEAAGFVEGSEVRYDKDNTYIILEYLSMRKLKVAYHIKKEQEM